MKMKVLILFLVTFVYAMADLPKITEIMNKIDDISELKSDGTAKVKITQQKVNQGLKVIECIYYRRDSDDSFLIIMTGPEVEKGNGYLRVGDNFWMYRRNTRTFQHINRDENIAGTDAKGEDFERRKMVELYKPAVDKNGREIITEEKLGKIDSYRIEIRAKKEDVAYPKKVYWVTKDSFLPLKEMNYSLSGTLMTTAYFINYTQIQGRYMWVKAMFIDEFEKGNKSVVEISDISLKKIDDSVFTKAYLENLSK